MSLYEALQALEPSLAAGFLPAMGTTFLAGILASAVCPCTLPVGLSVAGIAGASEAQTKRGGLAVAAAFFVGIVVSLTVLGTMMGRLGALATESFGRNWALVMALVSLAAAVLAFWWPRLRLDQLAAWRRPGVAGAFGYGLVFSIGTSIAPLLLLLAVAAGAGAPEYGLALALVFGIGRGLPFLLAGAAASALTGFMQLSRWSRVIQIASGVALLFVAWYYLDVYGALL
jgi:cytochrome c-type biogenesis protein